MKKISITYFIFFLFSNLIYGQGNYYLNRLEAQPDTTFIRNVKSQYFALYYPDVRAMGKGNTEIADGTKYNAMRSNPALLAFERNNVAQLKVVAGLALETVSMANYINNTESNFQKGESIERMVDAVKVYFKNDNNSQIKHEMSRTVLEALKYPQDILRAVVGEVEDPQTHGLHAFGEGTIQLGNFGISVSAYGESDIKAELGPVFERLAKYEFPQDLDNEEAVTLAMSEIGAMLDYAIDDETGLIDPRVLPAIYSFSFFDIATTFGYGLEVYDNLRLGLNVNLINRRFSAKRIDATKFDRIVEEVFSDFNTSSTGIGLDLGAHYSFKNNLSIGFSIQNLVATHKLNSDAELKFKTAKLEKDYDENGDLIFNANGDTAVVSKYRGYTIVAPVIFSIPIVTNVGLHYPINSDWDVALDMFDVFMQDTKINKYWNRLRIGTEYRMSIIEDEIIFTFRGGYSQLWPTIGLGLNLYDFISLDAAYYNDDRLDSDVALFQLTFSL